MTPKFLSDLSSWFDRYVAGFLRDDPDRDKGITTKIVHTRRVVANMLLLADSLGLSPEERRLAETVALLHDLGRFRQYEEYGTYLDARSVNHALLGIRETARHRLLADLPLAERRLIVRAISAHNHPRLPNIPDPRERRLTAMIRDADKLDIWRVYAEYLPRRDHDPNPVLDFGLPMDTPCSPTVVARLRRREPIRYEELGCLGDILLLQSSWIHDLNFPASFRLLRERGHLAAVMERIPRSDEVDALLAELRAHVDARAAA